jgi:hypothetical protein
MSYTVPQTTMNAPLVIYSQIWQSYFALVMMPYVLGAQAFIFQPQPTSESSPQQSD